MITKDKYVLTFFSEPVSSLLRLLRKQNPEALTGRKEPVQSGYDFFSALVL